MSNAKWLRSSLRNLSKKLTAQGHAACPKTVGRLLKEMDYSLKANEKRQAGKQHPERNAQFEYIQAQKQKFISQGWPIISIDAKKKELIGNFKNAGRHWCQQAERVNDHDFKSDALGEALPYGIYVLNQNLGYVYVGHSVDTAEFAVDVLSRWWQEHGQANFPQTAHLLVLCDSGGSNGYRLRLWKAQVQEKLANQLNLTVTICHYPTGASKWNPIEHRLFGPISINWAAEPLRTFEILLACIRGTQTVTGLEVFAFDVEQIYQKGRKVAKEVMDRLNIERHETCPFWNYTIRPQSASLEIGC